MSSIPAPARSLPRLSDRATATQSSAIRDLLDQAKRPGMISLAGGLPDADRFPTARLAALASELILQGDVLQYGLTAGDERARRALASSCGLATSADEVVVTTGSQQALDLIARVVVNPGDHVVVGDPDYLGALQVWRAYGADVRAVPIDRNGLDTERLEADLAWGLRPKLCYLVPHFHNPTGVTMSEERRAHLHELSTRYGFIVVEDDPYRDLFYDGPGPVDADGDPELTVRLRSTSKTLAPGLRVGVLAGPSWLREAVVTAKQSADLHTSTLTSAIAAAAVEADWFAPHLDGLRSCYRRKRDVLAAALLESFGDGVRFNIPRGGMFVWAHFARCGDTSAWLVRALDEGACFVPGAAFAVNRDLSEYVRLSFATGSESELREGVERMKASR